jgi:hypothetical protein
MTKRPYANTLEDKLKLHSKKDGECILWTGFIDKQGYGVVSMPKGGKYRTRYAHVVNYELTNGAVKNALVLDHLCRNRSCINLSHLEPVTRTENILRGIGWGAINKRKTHCPEGHEYTEENTYISRPQPHNRKTSGGRECRTCRRTRGIERRLKLKELANG